MATIKKNSGSQSRLRTWSQRIGWMVLIWFFSVAALGVAAGLMRWLMHALGMQ
ncbi:MULTISPECIES: DUF2474 domain-containing protein [unclassified Herbaspirillum]|uniref:DUF2474 domain-containing protein n=1 Tax=unclassified Herbaspirillum TaxID=2624150 RepID=UPI0016095112|nr:MULTISPECIES: DUF2474 domain-containing protein [unclassified Herbaspirillum]